MHALSAGTLRLLSHAVSYLKPLAEFGKTFFASAPWLSRCALNISFEMSIPRYDSIGEPCTVARYRSTLHIRAYLYRQPTIPFDL
jgi:hypothetical protein